MRIFKKQHKAEQFQKRRKKKLIELNRDILLGRFIIHLQPKQCLISDHVDHAEVLVRYHRHGKNKLPDLFIQELEELQLIHVIDLFVYEMTCRLVQTWKMKRQPYIHLSCNFSRITLRQCDIIKQLDVIRDRYKVQPHDIEIEITESDDQHGNPIYEHVGKQLHQAGYRLTLDDFGSGYGNLVFLSCMPFSTIKMDKTLIWELGRSQKMMVLLEKAIESSHQIGLEVVAEGVETQVQKDTLRAMGCDYIQGNYIHMPMSCAEFEWTFLGSKELRYCEDRKGRMDVSL